MIKTHPTEIFKEILVVATFETDPNTGKRKLVRLHFPTEQIRNMIDEGFLQQASRDKRP